MQLITSFPPSSISVSGQQPCEMLGWDKLGWGLSCQIWFSQILVWHSNHKTMSSDTAGKATKTNLLFLFPCSCLHITVNAYTTGMYVHTPVCKKELTHVHFTNETGNWYLDKCEFCFTHSAVTWEILNTHTKHNRVYLCAHGTGVQRFVNRANMRNERNQALFTLELGFAHFLKNGSLLYFNFRFRETTKDAGFFLMWWGDPACCFCFSSCSFSCLPSSFPYVGWDFPEGFCGVISWSSQQNKYKHE